MAKNTAELRSLLLETIQDVRVGKVDFKKAGAISSLAGKILYSAKLDIDFAKLVAQKNGVKTTVVAPFHLVGKQPSGKA